MTIVHAEDIIPKERKASCYNCGRAFDISRDIDIRIRNKYKIYQPKAVTMLKTSQRMELNFPMMSLPLGCAFWPVFGGLAGTLTLILLILVYFRVGMFDIIVRMGVDGYVLLFFVCLILVISYSIAAQINKFQTVTQIDIQAEIGKLTVMNIEKGQKQSGNEPPKRTKKELNPKDIQQFYVIERNINGHFFYSLCAMDRDKQEIEMIPLIKDLQIALFAEQELEEFYDIKDSKIEKEVRT
jgi:hypothetical protein